MKRNQIFSLFVVSTLIILAGCNGIGAQPTPTATATTIPTPTATELPMALKVNDEGIPVTEYQADLTRLQQAQSAQGITASAEDQSNQVIENFTDQLLLAEAATQGGFTLDDATLQSRIDALVSKLGGAEKFSAWESSNGYTDESFRAALSLEIRADWERDQIINSVPETADQVHALQILVQDMVNAQSLLTQLKNGADFATLASTLDPTTGGDLGWFPQGYLTQPDVETAAFALQPGQYSDVIKSDLGYHIIYVIERDANHPLSVDARRALQEAKLKQWLADQKTSATIVITLP
jgi:parvulin-like peptidyl-prolyl isomerase